MSVVECIKCRGEVSVPRRLSSAATVRCPLCREDFSYGELLASQPPELLVIDEPDPIADDSADEPSSGGFQFDGVSTAVGRETSAGPAVMTSPMVKDVSASTDETRPKRRPVQRRPKPKPKSAAVEIAKIIIGGAMGIVGALVILAWTAKIDPAHLGKFSFTSWAVPASLRSGSTTEASTNQSAPAGGSFDGGFSSPALDSLGRSTFPNGVDNSKKPRGRRKDGLNSLIDENQNSNGPTDNVPGENESGQSSEAEDPFAQLGAEIASDPFAAPPTLPEPTEADTPVPTAPGSADAGFPIDSADPFGLPQPSIPTDDDSPIPSLPEPTLPDTSLPAPSFPEPTTPDLDTPEPATSPDPDATPPATETPEAAPTETAAAETGFPDTGLGLTPDESKPVEVTPRPTALIAAEPAALEEFQRAARDTAILQQAYIDTAPAERELFKNFGKQFYEAAARAGEVTTNTDIGQLEIEPHVRSIHVALEEIVKHELHVKVLGAFGAMWISDAPWEGEETRPNQGVVIAGVVKSVESQDPFLKAEIEMRKYADGRTAAAWVLLEKLPSHTPEVGDRMIAIGRKVENPRDSITAYTGEESDIIYARMFSTQSSEEAAAPSPEGASTESSDMASSK